MHLCVLLEIVQAVVSLWTTDNFVTVSESDSWNEELIKVVFFYYLPESFSAVHFVSAIK